jgi:hypothetical protein
MNHKISLIIVMYELLFISLGIIIALLIILIIQNIEIHKKSTVIPSHKSDLDLKPTLQTITTPQPSSIYGGPVPEDTIRWNKGMLTSLLNTDNYKIGEWVHIGIAYTQKPFEYTYVDVYRLNIDPYRDYFNYSVVTKNGQNILLDTNLTHLENGDKFKVPGMEGKGLFIFQEQEKYVYTY